MPLRSLWTPPGDYTVTVKATGFNDFTATAVNANMGAVNTLLMELTGD